MTEMREAAFLTHNVTPRSHTSQPAMSLALFGSWPKDGSDDIFNIVICVNRSLVLIDELGRATSTLDGLAIAWSFAEFLLSLDA